MSTTLHARHRAEELREAAILDVTLEVLLESGFDGLTMDAVARQAHVGKATLYLRWGGKPELVVAALTRAAETSPVSGEIDCGSLRADLVELGRRHQQDRQRSGKLVLALAHAVEADTGIADAVRRLLTEPSKARSRAFAERAVARGEMPASSLDLPHVLDLLPSLLVANLLLAPQELVDVEAFVDAVLLPLLTRSF